MFNKKSILHAKMLDSIIDNPYVWWNSQKVQEARIKYCHQFAKISNNWLKVYGRFNTCSKKK